MAVTRLLPTDESHELIDLTGDICDEVLDPIVDDHEERAMLVAPLHDNGVKRDETQFPKRWELAARRAESPLKTIGHGTRTATQSPTAVSTG